MSIDGLAQVTLTNKEIYTLQKGEITYDSNQQQWFLGCPGGCEGVANLSAHAVTTNDDLVTATPSILCSCGAHYFIEHNHIRWI